MVKLSKDGGEEPGEPENPEEPGESEEPEEFETIEVGVNQLVLASMSDGSWGGPRTFTVSEDAIEYVIDDVGTEDSHIQLKQTGITLEKGQKYRVRFNATTTATRDIKVALMHNPEEGVWNWYGGTQQNILQDEDNVVEFEFTVTGDNCSDIIFQVSMGQMFNDVKRAVNGLSEVCLINRPCGEWLSVEEIVSAVKSECKKGASYATSI